MSPAADCVDHDTRQRTLSQLASHKTQQKCCSASVARENKPASAVARFAVDLSRDGGNASQKAIDFGKGQCCRDRRRVEARSARCVSDPDPALRQLARQIVHPQSRSPPLQRSQKTRELAHLSRRPDVAPTPAKCQQGLRGESCDRWLFCAGVARSPSPLGVLADHPLRRMRRTLLRGRCPSPSPLGVSRGPPVRRMRSTLLRGRSPAHVAPGRALSRTPASTSRSASVLRHTECDDMPVGASVCRSTDAGVIEQQQHALTAPPLRGDRPGTAEPSFADHLKRRIHPHHRNKDCTLVPRTMPAQKKLQPVAGTTARTRGLPQASH